LAGPRADQDLLGFAGWTFGDMLRDKKEIEALKKV
jgi:hypothetical protein